MSDRKGEEGARVRIVEISVVGRVQAGLVYRIRLSSSDYGHSKKPFFPCEGLVRKGY